jgi:hypothetical protein
MSVGYIRIEPLHNGYTVELDDPAIVQANKKNDNRKPSEPYSYKDPSRKFTFKTDKEVLAFLTKNLKKIVPSKMDDFGTSFDLATKEDC